MPEVEEPTEAEVVTEVEEPAAPETTAHVESSMLDSDAFVDRVADKVFDKMKVFTTDLISASQAAQQLVTDTMPVDSGAPEDVAPEEPQPDVAPQRRHKLFAQPMKRNQ